MPHRFHAAARALLCASAALVLATEARAQPSEEARSVAGLAAPAEIRVDKWGVPHIYAASVRDAFFLQGYNVARDRLWQVDLWRKRGLGLLARDFGPDYIAQDRAARLFLYRGDMDAEWAAYGPNAKTYAEAFTAGINAFVREIRDGERPLPEQFALAGSNPDFWSADDVVRIRSHGLTRNLSAEVKRARIACLAGLEATRLYKKLEPAWTTRVPEGLDPCDVPDAVLDDYELATAGVSFARGPGARAELSRDVPPEAIGSNNWTVSGERTKSGRPILANDPHRAHGVPSLRYVVHMEAPGFSVIGAGEPALPGVSIGHNGVIAFGLTIFAADQEDLHVYETDPLEPGRYRYGEGWETMRVVRETIEVKGEPAREVELRFTRHGPVVHANPTRTRAFAVRSVWSSPGTSAYFGSADYMTAKDWDGFKAALKGWGAPSENQVYADTKGHIGWIAAGRVPVRDNWDGLMPTPGDGRYEWRGFLGADDLPSQFDPDQGWIATANQMNLPDGFPNAERKVGFEWSNNARMTRIAEVLAAKPELTIEDSMALQTDTVNVVARPLLALTARLDPRDADMRAALSLLRGWDRRTDADSAGAALFETWIGKHLGRATVRRATPSSVHDLLGDGDLAAVVDYLGAPDAALGANPEAVRDEILLESLKSAYGEVRRRLGPDVSTWSWGRLHHARMEHALTPLAAPGDRARLAAGPAPMGGTALSPLAASWRQSDFRVTAGASFRMVLDVGAWDQSKVVNTPGQSGDPSSPHYKDLFPMWAAGQYAPLLYSREAVESATETVLKLSPK
jgi:penicillin amidase